MAHFTIVCILSYATNMHENLNDQPVSSHEGCIHTVKVNRIFEYSLKFVEMRWKSTKAMTTEYIVLLWAFQLSRIFSSCTSRFHDDCSFIYIQSVSGNLSYNIQHLKYFVITFFYEASGVCGSGKLPWTSYKSASCCDGRKTVKKLSHARKFIEESEKITTHESGVRWWVMCQDVNVDIHLWAKTECNFRLNFGFNSHFYSPLHRNWFFYF